MYDELIVDGIFLLTKLSVNMMHTIVSHINNLLNFIK